MPGEALSVTVNVPVRDPLATGLKVTVTVQLAPAAREVPQASDCEKSPLVEKPVRVNAAVPVLVRITSCAVLLVPTFWLAKLRLAGDNFAAGAVPVPVSPTVCSLLAVPPLLSVIVSAPLRLPVAAGAKVTLIAQLAPGATEVPQVLVSAKSAALVPFTAIPPMLSVPAPVFESVIVSAGLLVPTS